MYGYEEPFGAKIFKLVLLIIIGLIGIIGNILVCIVILKTAKLRSSTYYFICSLAVADIGVLLVCFPLAVVQQELVSEWPFGKDFCLYIYPATETAFGASIWSITVIAFERYRVIIVNRPKITTHNSKILWYVWLVIAVVWLGNFLLAYVPIYFMIKYHEDSKRKVCYPEWTFEGKPNVALQRAYMIALTLFWYIFPLGAISFTYWAVSRKMKERNEFLTQIGMRDNEEIEDLENDCTCLKNDAKSRTKRDAKARRLLSPLVIVFAITMLPSNLFRIAATSWSNFQNWGYFWLLYDITIFFTVFNSAANPFIYAIVSKEFSTGFGNLFRLKQLKRRKDSHWENGTTNITTLSSIMKIMTPKSQRKNQIEACDAKTKSIRNKHDSTNTRLSDDKLFKL